MTAPTPPLPRSSTLNRAAVINLLQLKGSRATINRGLQKSVEGGEIQRAGRGRYRVLSQLPVQLPLTTKGATELPLILDENQETRGVKKLDLIQPMIAYSEGDPELVARFPNLTAVVESLAKEKSIWPSALWSIWTRYNAGGRTALTRKPRKDRGSTIWKGYPKADVFIQQKYYIEKLNAKHVHEVLVREWSTLGDNAKPPRCAAPSYRTLLRRLTSLPLPAKVYCREGKEAFTTKCSPFILRKAPPAMEWWISDHRCLDVFCRNTLFPHLDRNQMYRPWLTAVYDWGSRMLVGFAFSPTPSSATIGSALRMAARDFGFPLNLYWDNGKDYQKAKREIEEIQLAPHIEDLLRLKRVKVTSALPRHPRSKPVEAYFVRWSMRFDAMWGAAYAGNRPQNCRPECREAQKQHKEFLKGNRAESPLPTDEALITAAREWIFEYNHETELDALDGHTPESVMNEHVPAENRRPASDAELSRLLSERCERQVKAGGCVEIDRMDYEPDEASLGALVVQQGRRLTILRDPYNLADAVAVDDRGFYIGHLRLKVAIEQDPADGVTRDDIKECIRRERAVLRACRDYRELLTHTAAAMGWKWEHELLLDRARARTGTDDFSAAKAAAPGARRTIEAPKAAMAPAFASDSFAKLKGILDDAVPEN